MGQGRVNMSANRMLREAQRAIFRVPMVFRDRASRVVVRIERVAPREEATSLVTRRRRALLGMYRGFGPVTSVASPPDTIVLFRRPLLRNARTRARLRREIVRTVYHEFGHALGLSEGSVEHV